MDKETIIREWFYRLPKGYAEAPYTKGEMDILHAVLEENGLNGSIFVNEDFQLDQAFNDAEEVDMTNKKHTLKDLQEWKENHRHLINENLKHPEVVKLLSNVKNRLDQEDLEDIQAVIIRSAFKGKVLKYFKEKGIVAGAYQQGKNSIRALFDGIASLPDVDKVIEYFEDPVDLVIGEDGRGNLLDSGLEKEVIFELMIIYYNLY